MGETSPTEKIATAICDKLDVRVNGLPWREVVNRIEHIEAGNLQATLPTGGPASDEGRSDG